MVDVLKQPLGNGQMCKFSALMHIILPMRSPSEPTYPDIRPLEFFGYCREATVLGKLHYTRSCEETEPQKFLVYGYTD
jgi:hypothetical protein